MPSSAVFVKPAPQRDLGKNRNKLISAVQIRWKQLRPDLRHDEEALREERLAFINDLLKLKAPVASTRDLTDAQLGRVLDAFRRMQPGGVTTTARPPVEPSATAEVVHLATREQLHTIGKLFNHMGWHVERRAAFVAEKFKRPNPAMLTPKQASSLMMILLTIAATRDLKRDGFTHTRDDVRAYIPTLKSKLGIDTARTR